jgi:hypothetical protein
MQLQAACMEALHAQGTQEQGEAMHMWKVPLHGAH